MKKVFKGLSVALATAALGVATTAYADNTDVEFNIEPTYTVTIPPKVTLEKTRSGAYSKTEPIIAEDVFLRENQKLVVSVGSKSAFRMRTQTLLQLTDFHTQFMVKWPIKNKDWVVL